MFVFDSPRAPALSRRCDVACGGHVRARSRAGMGVSRRRAPRRVWGSCLMWAARGDKSFQRRGLCGARTRRAGPSAFTSSMSSRPMQTIASPRCACSPARGFRSGELASDTCSRAMRRRGRAHDYPGVKFACVDYSLPERGSAPPNVVGLNFREEEGAYLAGVMAALTSTSHRVGFVGGMDIPLIRKFEHGYQSGVRAACADCSVIAAYAGSTPSAFRDPARGEALALRAILAGADVIFHASGTTGHGVFVAAHHDYGVSRSGWIPTNTTRCPT